MAGPWERYQQAAPQAARPPIVSGDVPAGIPEITVHPTPKASGQKPWERYAGASASGDQPAGMSASQFDQRFDPSADRGSALDPIMAGMTANFSDEIMGGIGGVASMVAGKGFQPGYDKMATATRQRLERYRRDHPIASTALEVAGAVPTALAVPGGPGIAGAMRGGALFGGLSAAGADNGGLVDRAAAGAEGAVTGAALGGAASGTLAALGAVGRSQPVNAIRGAIAPAREAARRVVAAVSRDTQGQPQAAVQTLRQGQAQGNPLIIADTGETTRSLMRSAANTSPEGRAALNAAVDQRYEAQVDRAVQIVRANSPAGGRAPDVLDNLHAAARRLNRPAYQRAYATPVTVTPDIQAALQAPAGQQALRQAQRMAANEGAPIDPANIDTRALDYVKRALDDQIGAARRGGRNQEVRAITMLRNRMLSEVDRQNPAYRAARQGAATFFGAEDALEAGANFVTSKVENEGARRALARMNPAERQLFAEGFTTELVNQLREVSNRRSVINSAFVNSPAARERIRLALGQRAAGHLEEFLRVENIMDMARRQLQGNSTTARQLAELGLAGGAGGLVLSGGQVQDPRFWIGAALAAGTRRGLYHIDAGVARRVGEMLASDSPQVLQEAIDIIARTPGLTGAIRRIEAVLSKTAGGQVGGSRPLALTVTRGSQAEGASDSQPQ